MLIVSISLILAKKIFGNYRIYVLLLSIYLVFGSALFLIYGPINFFSDSTHYLTDAQYVLEWWAGKGGAPYEGLWQFLNEKKAWPTVIACIFWLIGNVPFAVILLNILLIALTAMVTASTVTKISAKKVHSKLFLGFFIAAPFIPIFGINMGREAIYWLATSIMVNAVADFLVGKSQIRIGTFVFGSLLLIIFRPNLGIPQIYAFLIPIFVIWAIRKYPYTFKKSFMIIVAGFLLALSLIPAKALVTSDANDIEVTRRVLSEGTNSGFPPETIVVDLPETIVVDLEDENSKIVDTLDASDTGNTWLDYGINAIQTFPRGIFGPYIYELNSSPVMIMSGINLVYWLFLFVLSIWGLILKYKVSAGTAYLFISLIILLIISSILTNYGILVRFRSAAELVLLPYSILVLSQIIEKRHISKLLEKS